MMFKGESSGELNGFLDEGSRVEGELSFRDTFRIDGELTGKIVSDGELMIGESGLVDGEVEVASVYVGGTVKGQIRAQRRLEIAAHGRVVADVTTPALIIEEGAFFEGRCVMQPSAQKNTTSERQRRKAGENAAANRA